MNELVLFQTIFPLEEIKELVEELPPDDKNAELLAVIVPLFIILVPDPVTIEPFSVKFPEDVIFRFPDVDTVTEPLKVKALFRVVVK